MVLFPLAEVILHLVRIGGGKYVCELPKLAVDEVMHLG
jgi:hypothetical protein